jgi:hypothetical protein
VPKSGAFSISTEAAGRVSEIESEMGRCKSQLTINKWHFTDSQLFAGVKGYSTFTQKMISVRGKRSLYFWRRF